MRKLEINYDFYDKIHEAQGKYKVRRWIKNNKIQDGIIVTITAMDIVEYFLGLNTLEETIVDIVGYYAALGVIMPLFEVMRDSINERNTGKTQVDYAYDQLNNLVSLLNSINIDVNIKELMNAVIYHKNYKLDMESAPGIIRERYFEIETNNNKFDRPISIKEEHKMGSKTYELTLESPKKKMVYKPAFGM